MEYRVETLAAAVATSVDTIRFYQARGLLPAPRRVGRVAWYDDAHLERLHRIRELKQQGFSLAQIQRLLARSRGGQDDALVTALVEQERGGRLLTRDELAAETGVPEVLVRAAEAAGLGEPVVVDGEPRFGESDVAMARAALEILEAGFPLQKLLALSVGHARHVGEVCEQAIDLFDEHVRGREDAPGDREAISDAFRRLLPQVTRLVALHFQRTLVSRALNRLSGSDQHEALEAAREATQSARLEVDVAWR